MCGACLTAEKLNWGWKLESEHEETAEQMQPKINDRLRTDEVVVLHK